MSEKKVVLPHWADRVRQKYLGGEASIFILHGNVFDSVMFDDQITPLHDFVANHLLGNKKNIVLSIDPSHPPEFNSVVQSNQVSVSLKNVLENNKQKNTLAFVESVLTHDASVGIIIPYASGLAPAGDDLMLSPQDKMASLTLHRWSMSRWFKETDNVLFLITESLSGLNQKLTSNPRVMPIEISLPSHEERANFIHHLDKSLSEKILSHFAHYTSGLKLVQIEHLLRPQKDDLDQEAREKFILQLLDKSKDAQQRAKKLVPLTQGMNKEEIQHLINPEKKLDKEDVADQYQDVLALIAQRKKEIIETECSGLLEFIKPSFDLSAVGGNEGIKDELNRIAKLIKAGDFKKAPMGILMVGAMGCGKTFIAKAFAKSSGLPAVTLKNFRSKWVGSTEANLEKVLSMVKTLGPVIVVIDEGDRAFGGEEGENDGGTSSRIMARLKEFMSDTSHRGQVLFILMTNRPDKLDVDIKRAGRLDVKIPLFYPQTGGEVAQIMTAILQRSSIKTKWKEKDLLEQCEKLKDYSNADLEAICLLALNNFSKNDVLSIEGLAHAIDEYLPSKNKKMLEYMEILAVSEASRKSMLPEKYKHLNAEQISEKLGLLKLQIGR